MAGSCRYRRFAVICDRVSASRDAREAPTVKDLAERYRAEHLPRKAKSSQVNDWAMIVNDILPELGNRKVADVHHGDIVALHQKISARGPTRANRVLAVASKMFSLSLLRGRARTRRGGTQRRATPARASRGTKRKGRRDSSRRLRSPP